MNAELFLDIVRWDISCGENMAFEEKKNKKYEKPVIRKITKMRFPIDIIEATGKGTVCKQCSSCHNCR